MENSVVMTVKCQDCGYLTAEHSGTHLEIRRNQRTTGDRPDAGVPYKPMCHEEVPIHEEYAMPDGNPPSGTDKKRVYLEVISLGRVCPKFRSYQPGRSPEQHRQKAEAVSEAEAKKMDHWELLRWQADESSKAHMREMERDAVRDAAQAERDRIARESAAAQTADAHKNAMALAESNRLFQDALDKRSRRDDYVRWVVGGLAIAIASMAAFFGSRYFATPSNPPAMTQPK